MGLAINCHKLTVNSPLPDFLSGVWNSIFYCRCFLIKLNMVLWSSIHTVNHTKINLTFKPWLLSQFKRCQQKQLASQISSKAWQPQEGLEEQWCGMSSHSSSGLSRTSWDNSKEIHCTLLGLISLSAKWKSMLRWPPSLPVKKEGHFKSCTTERVSLWKRRSTLPQSQRASLYRAGDGSASSPAIPVLRPPRVKAPNPETTLNQAENNASTTLVTDWERIILESGPICKLHLETAELYQLKLN